MSTQTPKRSDEEILAGFEYALWHLGAAFSRWRRDCFAAVSDLGISGSETSILHAVEMNGTAKGLMDISRLLHRDDLPNLQYGLKKLLQIKLIEKRGTSRKTTNYVISESGKAVVLAYKKKRQETLLRLFKQLPQDAFDMENMVALMHVMTGIYDQSGDLLLHHHQD